MGSYYILYKDSTQSVGLAESSNTLSLLKETADDVETLTPYLAPEAMLKILLQGVTACSYWMSEEEFNRVMATLETFPY